MSLWMPWWNAIWHLRPAFSRLRSFLWFATAVAGFTVRTELLGVTSLVRALKLDARFYNKLVDHFHSPAVQLDRLAALWTQTVLRLFPQPLRINGRCVVVGDGIKVPKRGRRMPGVKLLHQQSESNTKPEYIMGHSLQAVEPARAGRRQASSPCRLPSASTRGWWSNRDRRTLLDKMLALLGIVAIAQPCYFVADAYYAARKIVAGLLKENNHLVTRVKSNAVAYTAHQQRGPRKRGRPRVYGRKVRLSSLLDDPKGLQQVNSPVYGERRVAIQFPRSATCCMPGRPARALSVAVIHPTRGSCLLMCTGHFLGGHRDHSSLRPALQDRTHVQAGGAADRLVQLPLLDVRHEGLLRRRSGNQRLHRASPEYRDAVRRKLHAYHVFIQAAVVCQGLLRYLAVAFPQRVWDAFGSWLHAPSGRESHPRILVVANAMRQSMPEFLLNAAPGNIFAKFVIGRQDTSKMEAFRLAS